jgi:uncharacterized protein (TIGR03067 family)
MKLSFLLVLAAGLLPGADPPKDEAVKKELDSLKGTWKIVAAEHDTEAIADLQDGRVVIEGQKLTLSVGDRNESVTFKVDPAKKPKEVDLFTKKEETVVGIYTLDGDELKICFLKSGTKRPTEFATAVGSGLTLVTCKRAKP